MNRRTFSMVFYSAFLAYLVGCGSDGGSAVTLAPAGGTVTFRGAPLPDATVTFVPESGPIATGITDLSGKFTLSTGSRPGVAVGTCKVAVSAYAGGGAGGASPADKMSGPVTSQEQGLARQKEMMEMQRKISEGQAPPQEVLGSGSKSVIPERYTKAETSQLSFKVESGAKNEFEIKLTE